MRDESLSNIQPGEDAPRILFLGTSGAFSVPPLVALLDAGVTVCAVVVPSPKGPHAAPAIKYAPDASERRRLPMAQSFTERTIAQIAWEQRIPVVEVGRLSRQDALDTLAAFHAHALCVACFPQRIPEPLLHLPLGALNLHPSLLPAYRGPAPGFWVLRNGEQFTGATVHLMDERFDAGDILLQEEFEIPEGITSAALEQSSADVGAPLMVRALRVLANGTARPSKQDEQRASYYSWPREEDFIVPTTRPARWAFNFIRGVASWEWLPELQISNERFAISEALDYQPEGTLGQPYQRQGQELWAQCAPGVLHVLLAEKY
ncbi:MAG TPA: methionyl-tRNA formyltransferase [Ktedonobacterales bacterium]